MHIGRFLLRHRSQRSLQHPLLWLQTVLVLSLAAHRGDGVACRDLFAGQLCCVRPSIDVKTQQPVGCSSNHTVTLPCFAHDGVLCDGALHTSWPTRVAALAEDDGAGGEPVQCAARWYIATTAVLSLQEPCAYNDPDNLHSFSTALTLSVFLGWLGIDRFYLGYPALGLAKLLTCGFLFVGQVIISLFPPSYPLPLPVYPYPASLFLIRAHPGYPRSLHSRIMCPRVAFAVPLHVVAYACAPHPLRAPPHTHTRKLTLFLHFALFPPFSPPQACNAETAPRVDGTCLDLSTPMAISFGQYDASTHTVHTPSGVGVYRYSWWISF